MVGDGIEAVVVRLRGAGAGAIVGPAKCSGSGGDGVVRCTDRGRIPRSRGEYATVDSLAAMVCGR